VQAAGIVVAIDEGKEFVGGVILAGKAAIAQNLGFQDRGRIEGQTLCSNHPFMNIMSSSGGMLLTVGSRTYQVDAPKFIREDLADLATLGFIKKHRHNNDGEPV
jgi:hypothetical protein